MGVDNHLKSLHLGQSCVLLVASAALWRPPTSIYMMKGCLYWKDGRGQVIQMGILALMRICMAIHCERVSWTWKKLIFCGGWGAHRHHLTTATRADVFLIASRSSLFISLGCGWRSKTPFYMIIFSSAYTPSMRVVLLLWWPGDSWHVDDVCFSLSLTPRPIFRNKVSRGRPKGNESQLVGEHVFLFLEKKSSFLYNPDEWKRFKGHGQQQVEILWFISRVIKFFLWGKKVFWNFHQGAICVSSWHNSHSR